MASTDLYALLKVDKDVQAPQLKKAYYALARKVHPDKRPGDEQAKADFLALKKAYDILSDPVRRRRYDRTGSVEDDADFAVIGRVVDGLDTVAALDALPVVKAAAMMGQSDRGAEGSREKSCAYGSTEAYCSQLKPLKKVTLARAAVL